MNHTQPPSLTDTFLVTAEQIDGFRNAGHVLLKNVLTPDEVSVYRPIINSAAYRCSTETRKLEERDTYGKAFLQMMNLWEQDEAVKTFTLATRFAKIAAALLGVDAVRIYHDQALYKEAGGGFTPWHQDQYYWPLSTSNTITMWMPLVAVAENMGMLTFASGSHRSGFVENVAISDESDALLENVIKERGYAVSRAPTMQAGDATFHYGWTLHSAPGNHAQATREVMTIIYFADGATVTEPQNKHQEADRQRWLQGLAPGAKAASALNPVAA